MNVSDAVDTRLSCRAFTDEPVSGEVVRRLLEKAARSPSGGNVQPWRIYALTGPPLQGLVNKVNGQLASRPMGSPTEYDIYPKGLTAPYRDYRYKVGEDMYALLDIPREDKAARLGQLAKNFGFFGAPVGLFLYLDRQMGPPQWSDAGMFLQTFMLLAREEGLHTCAQEAWAMWHLEVAEHVGAPENEMLFCGLALGHKDKNARVNQLRSERAAVDDFTTFQGF